MNTLNAESLLVHDPKHLFGPSTSGGMAMTSMSSLGQHLGHIGTSISGAGVMNPCLSMANSHALHVGHHQGHAHHPAAVHHHPHQTLHPIAGPSFALHGHLSSMSGAGPSGSVPRRMSSNGLGLGTSRMSHKSSSSSSTSTKQFGCPMCNKLFTQKGKENKML